MKACEKHVQKLKQIQEDKIMKFFIDTAKVEDIKAANDMGIICGVTTNPSLIAKEGRDFNASMILESSPPDTILPRGFKVSPGLVEISY